MSIDQITQVLGDDTVGVKDMVVQDSATGANGVNDVQPKDSNPKDNIIVTMKVDDGDNDGDDKGDRTIIIVMEDIQV